MVIKFCFARPVRVVTCGAMDEEEIWMILEEEARAEANAVDLAEFGEQWMYRDLTSELRDAIRDRALPVRGMMTSEEQRVLERLPEVLTVYRGTWAGAPVGASWSLRRRTAATFWADEHGVAIDLLLTGRVAKSAVIALKLGRGEHEIISVGVEVVGRERVAQAASG
jgi:hypothetical protein